MKKMVFFTVALCFATLSFAQQVASAPKLKPCKCGKMVEIVIPATCDNAVITTCPKVAKTMACPKTKSCPKAHRMSCKACPKMTACPKMQRGLKKTTKICTCMKNCVKAQQKCIKTCQRKQQRCQGAPKVQQPKQHQHRCKRYQKAQKPVQSPIIMVPEVQSPIIMVPEVQSPIEYISTP